MLNFATSVLDWYFSNKKYKLKEKCDIEAGESQFIFSDPK